MNGCYLKFYTQESRHHQHQLLHEWLVDVGRELQLPGCSVFRAIGGFGHHHALHSNRFFELQGDLPVEIVFALTEEQARTLLDRVEAEKIGIFYVRLPAEFGFTAAADPA